MNDRRVHAVMANGAELVRYDRAGKWFAEGGGWKRQVSFGEAVSMVMQDGARVRLGVPGGGRFDARINEMRGVGYAIDVEDAAA